MAPPPPGPTLYALLERLSSTREMYLGAYSSTALLRCDGDHFELFSLFGAILGVSPEHDRMPQIGERLFEAHGVDDLVSKLVMVWTSDYGVMLAPRERLYATVSGDRRQTMIELRKRWEGGLSLAEAPDVLDGKRSVDHKQAKTVFEIAQATGATVSWRCVRS